jgi:hypothetical protein
MKGPPATLVDQIVAQILDDLPDMDRSEERHLRAGIGAGWIAREQQSPPLATLLRERELIVAALGDPDCAPELRRQLLADLNRLAPLTLGSAPA